MIAPHATPAAAYAALGEFLSEDAPGLIQARINTEYETPERAPSIRTYSAEIHVSESVLPEWLERHGFVQADVQRGDWTGNNDVLSVTSHTGVMIFALTTRPAESGEDA